ncbi:MAG TPA: hypothetical protein VIP07_02380 [Candidatus Limnocylindria bacterium]|jgi:hypothetical protein
MRPFRLRVVTAILLAFLMLGTLGSAVNAANISTSSFPDDPWPGLSIPTTSFPDDPWPGLS